MGEVNTNKTKKSVSIVTQTNVGSLANIMECISNGAARTHVYVKIQGEMVPVHIKCSILIMSTLRHSDAQRWFKLHEAKQPWVKFTVITLLSYVIVALNKAAKLPQNQRVLLAGTPKLYTPNPLQNCITAVLSWKSRLQSCVNGGEQMSIPTLYMSTYHQHFNLSPTHGTSFIPSQLHLAIKLPRQKRRNGLTRTLTRGKTSPLRHLPQNPPSRTGSEQTPAATRPPHVTSSTLGTRLYALNQLSLYKTSSPACPTPATANAVRP